jgi:hypothetical protein
MSTPFDISSISTHDIAEHVPSCPRPFTGTLKTATNHLFLNVLFRPLLLPFSALDLPFKLVGVVDINSLLLLPLLAECDRCPPGTGRPML